MERKNFTIASPADGILLAVTVIKPEIEGEPKGIVQFVHGMVEHRKRYFNVMEWFARRGYVCIIHDHRGHGESARSEKDFGYFGRGGWKALVDDIKAVGDSLRKEYGRIPFFLVGHSMGSMAARSYLKRYPDTIDGLVVCGSPSDNPAKGMGKAVAMLSGIFCGWHHRSELLKKISFKGYNRPFRKEGFAKAWTCSDRAVLEDYHSDPLCDFTFTSNGFLNLFRLMGDCYSPDGWTVTRPNMPVLFLSGSQDPCRKSDEAFLAAVQFLRDRGYGNVSCRLYPGMRHAVLLETDREMVWKDILDFIE